MISYPLSTLMLAGIRDIPVITTPTDRCQFELLLGDGSQWGIRLSCAEQPRPAGLAEAFIIGADFIGDDRVAMVLGYNIFFGHGLPELSMRAASREDGATVFAYHVRDPERYGVVTFDEQERPLRIEEKAKQPTSNWAITGLFFRQSRRALRAPRSNPQRTASSKSQTCGLAISRPALCTSSAWDAASPGSMQAGWTR
jgi:glucose-1-phosphate thymidylyltransferase